MMNSRAIKGCGRRMMGTESLILEGQQIIINLTELKKKSVPELIQISDEYGLENMARSRKQDILFAILKAHAKRGEDIYGDGVLEILQDGFGFLRSAEGSYLA